MVVRFESHRPRPPEGAETPAFVPTVSPELLERHGGRLLDPTRPEVLGWPESGRYLPTVYRPGVLLVAADVWRDEAHRQNIGTVLRTIGLDAIGPTEVTSNAPVRIILRPVDATTAVSVDAWAALQQLRAATYPGGTLPDATVVARISLEHLIASTDGSVTATPWAISGEPIGSFDRSTGRNRIPIAVAAAPPNRRQGLNRRPVVAVVDTGCAPHPQLDIYDPDQGGVFGDEFITVAPDIQKKIIDARAGDAVDAAELIADFRDGPMTSQPLVGELADAYGHGTFIAGIVRQAAPDAAILAIRAVHSDKIGHAGDALVALEAILERATEAQQGIRPEQMVHVVSFSAGYYDEWTEAPHLKAVVSKLWERGVVILAAAGNDATDRPFYPAALPQVIGVGALNPDGSKALFSNDAAWVRCWATGAAVASMFPTGANGSEAPGHDLPQLQRRGHDPDNFAAGYAVWCGTSFATPLAAAEVAKALLAVAASDPALAMDRFGLDVTLARARAAMSRLGAPWWNPK